MSGGLSSRSALIARLRIAVLVLPLASGVPASAEPFPLPEPAPTPPFTATLSNNVPLAFGMNADDVSRALREPLYFIEGRPGDEILLAFRNIGGSGLFPQRHRLYLQFRKGRLTGWKGDWGHNWMWQ